MDRGWIVERRSVEKPQRNITRRSDSYAWKKTLDQYAMDISSNILFGLDARPGLAVRYP